MNKRGLGPVIMFPVLLVMMFVVGAAIVFASLAFSGEKLDPREAELLLLEKKTRDCFSSHDMLADKFDLNECGFNKNIIEGDFLILISGDKSVHFGIVDYQNRCFFTGQDKEGPLCRSFEINKGGKSYDFIVGINNRLKRVVI